MSAAELLAFYRARLDEDEAVARACPDHEWRSIGQGAGERAHDTARSGACAA
jgi:hypothetical protein